MCWSEVTVRKRIEQVRVTISVLHVYRTYFPDPPGGLQEAIRQIALSSQRYGVSSRVFTLSPHPEPPVISTPEGEVIRARSWMAPASCDIGGVASFRRLAALAKSADVIHYHFPWPFADVLHAVVRARTPAILTYHSDIVRQQRLAGLYGPMMRRMLQSMSAVVATSPAYAQTSPVLLDPMLRGRVEIIPLGIDERSYPVEDDGVFARIGVAPDRPYFLFIGVLRYYKGLHTLIEAATRVKAKIVIAGSGPEEERLRARVDRCGARNVVFAGQVSDAEKVVLLKGCRAVVLPSHLRSEAFGMVLVEAAMYGRPMISCEIGTGTSYVNAHGETGLVVAPENPAELAGAMNGLFEDDTLSAKLGEAARLRYEQMFSSDALGRAYTALYRRVAGS